LLSSRPVAIGSGVRRDDERGGTLLASMPSIAF
jgi:hypothetical protein